MSPQRDLLATLPVELLYEIQHYAASEAIPLTCRRLHNIFKSASPIVHADYLIARYLTLPTSRRTNVLTYVLRFPLCTPAVLAALLEHPSFPYRDPPPLPTDTTSTSTSAKPPELPRRLFRRLSPSGNEALPLLHFLYRDSVPARALRPPPDVDSHDGYPLVRAVSVGAVPVVRFLLEHGASPRRRSALSVRLAIKRGDLALVRLLVEPPDAHPDERRAGKRRRLADRVQVNAEMLKVAVAYGAHDIAEYLMNEKGCVPDLRTLSLLSVIHHNTEP